MSKVVIFDKDGVIVETKKLHFEKWKRTFNQHNKKFNEEILNQMMGRSARENIKKFLDPNLSDEFITKILSEQLKSIISMFDRYVSLVPGILNFLKKLKEAKTPVALATSSRLESMDLVLDKFKLRSYFQIIINANQISRSKPDPEIYLKAANQLKINPKDCVVFEDSYSGVEAAKRAGMKVVLVMTSHTRKDIPAVDLAIKDFTKININDIRSL
ncbi:hypothetical protein A2767_04385 [Candidatus Roizmanbacteria bacterium RIFCSPHIGHO2_01_FULL_35_10]|uniref:Beta-phosphoglucomutase n=1 Tax=Candidatus Roizmanbacteria bacterium RIFCSPLOWO2_01_FULL_35_13 TaxID=1802055 RepID=A0A1F7I8H9_9BACT|nr:MAG: hypothetical protein A2767_04385 [Candidatus Roizmanbacteria bacterium RIFCSPHIGHO2_01_FULL_35_10]OGK39666.1 MAG: hypothetical protein A3A74_07830 [Candidatus Roizmanbacteria bacterium RIFCSPLOWO2_01_FULL_35_13]